MNFPLVSVNLHVVGGQAYFWHCDYVLCLFKESTIKCAVLKNGWHECECVKVGMLI